MDRAAAAYAAAKLALLTAALARAGFDDVPIAPMQPVPPASRRRVDLALLRAGDGVRVGLHPARSHDVVDLHECLVLRPELFRLLAPLRALLARVGGLRRSGGALLNLFDTGPDLLLRLDGVVTAADRATLARFAAAQGVPRIAVAGLPGEAEVAAQLGPVWHRFGGVRVSPPPGAFLQASAEGEAAIRAAVLAGLPARTSRVIELFAGIGTLSFPLAERAVVAAYEGGAAAFAALRAAAGGTRVRPLLRDLARRPLTTAELRGTDAVVLDPPHGGALPQARALAAGGVPGIVYVSCNPATFARDAAVLRAGGYQLTGVTPIDQFVWSAQLEVVGVFRA